MMMDLVIQRERSNSQIFEKKNNKNLFIQSQNTNIRKDIQNQIPKNSQLFSNQDNVKRLNEEVFSKLRSTRCASQDFKNYFKTELKNDIIKVDQQYNLKQGTTLNQLQHQKKFFDDALKIEPKNKYVYQPTSSVNFIDIKGDIIKMQKAKEVQKENNLWGGSSTIQKYNGLDFIMQKQQSLRQCLQQKTEQNKNEIKNSDMFQSFKPSSQIMTFKEQRLEKGNNQASKTSFFDNDVFEFNKVQL